MYDVKRATALCGWYHLEMLNLAALHQSKVLSGNAKLSRKLKSIRKRLKKIKTQTINKITKYCFLHKSKE